MDTKRKIAFSLCMSLTVVYYRHKHFGLPGSEGLLIRCSSEFPVASDSGQTEVHASNIIQDLLYENRMQKYLLKNRDEYMDNNSLLHTAKIVKNDEFYTRLEDIEKELAHYTEYFKGKSVYCNCDRKESNFYRYFKDNFQKLKLKKIVCTSYNSNGYGIKIVYDGTNEIVSELFENGDFRSSECIDILNNSDVIVTNPPFSLFREYINLLMANDKKFLIIGNMNAITCKDIFPYIKENRVWFGYKCFGGGMNMIQPKEFFDEDKAKRYSIDRDGNIIKNIMGCIWFTNIENNKRHTFLNLSSKYNATHYPKYDYLDAININKVDDIPNDYYDIMGVPITFLDRYCPEQFEIIGLDRYVEGNKYPKKRMFINGKEIYARIIIRRK